MDHLSDEEITGFFFGPPRRHAFGVAANHLLLGCPTCRSRAAFKLAVSDPALATPVEAFDVEELFRRSSLRRYEASRAIVDWAYLSQLSEAERLKAVEGYRYRRYGLVIYLLEQAEACPSRGRLSSAAEYLRLARAVCEYLPERIYGASPIADLCLRQEVTLAHICRHEQKFHAAREALKRADHFRQRAGDRLEHARFCRVEAALLYDLGHFEEALGSSVAATEVYCAAHDQQSQARSLLQESIILAEYDPERGAEKARSGLTFLGRVNGLTYVCGLHTLALCLIKSHRAEDARLLLDNHRRTIEEVTDARSDLLFRWLDAYILRSRGKLEDTNELLRFLSRRFNEEGMFQEMVLVEIERIQIKVESGKWKSALNLARRLTPHLSNLGLRHDLQAMWVTLQDGLAQRHPVIEVARDFYRRRWRVERNPSSVSGGVRLGYGTSPVLA